MKKVLITGATGLLGRALMKVFSKDAECLGISRTREAENVVQIDLRDDEALEECIADFAPDLIIHAAAIRHPDVCENDIQLTYNINIRSTSILAQMAKHYGAQFCYISTDYVFDGKEPPFDEESKTSPLNSYGHSKLDGELAALAAEAETIILRIPVLYGSVETIDESAVTVIAKTVLAAKKGEVDHWAQRFPTHVEDVAEALHRLHAVEHEKGIYHFSAAECFTKFEMAQMIAEDFGLPKEQMIALSEDKSLAPRPWNCQLQTDKLAELIELPQRSFRLALKEALTPLMEKS